MRYQYCAVILLVCLLALLPACGYSSQDAPLEVYLIDPCGGCQGAAGPGCGECKLEVEAFLRYRALLSDVGQPKRVIRIFNLRRNPELYDGLELRILARQHESFRLPILMIGEEAFPADGQADQQVREHLLTGLTPEGLSLNGGEQAAENPLAEEAERSMIYLYSKYCDACKLIAPWLEDQLPEGVRLLRYDIASQKGLEVEWEVEKHFGITQEAFIVPALISGDFLMLGSQQIQEGFAIALEKAHNTPLSILLTPAE